MDQGLLVATGDSRLSTSLRVYFGQRGGYRVQTASDGLECLGKLRQYLPSLLILDMNLLWGGGDGVLARLRDWPEARETRVILIDAAEDKAHTCDCAGPPVIGSIRRPVRIAELERLVREAAILVT